MNITTYLTNVSLSNNKDTNISTYIGKYNSLFSQLYINGAPNRTTRINLLNQNQIEVKWLDQHKITRSIEPYKTVTTWYLATVFYQSIPIAILRNTDNREDRYPKVLLINKTQHAYAGAYLFQFLKADPGPELEIYDTSGSFSGDVIPHIINTNYRYYDIVTDQDYLNRILQYTEIYNY